MTARRGSGSAREPSSDVVLIRRSPDIIASGGKRRGRPALLAATACVYRGTQHHKVAAVIEMIHTATLLHDDVVDESLARRGHATANAMFGNAARCWSVISY
jgi:octaprenyl-diphosphate synthase